MKPANIKLRPDGTVKVLDFGLAKALDPAPTAIDTSQSPTITSPAMTRLGVIMGTAAYTPPEQARGKTVDKRADIWAFGCVLYEMLTGRRAIEGDTVTDIVVAVLTKEPDWAALPATTPANIRKLLRRCLEKDPKRRLRDIGDARAELESPEPSERFEPAPSKAMRGRYTLSWAIAAVLFAAMTIGLAVLYFRQTPVEPPLAKLQLLPPEKSSFGAIAISPDGRRVAFTAADASGKPQLWEEFREQPFVGVEVRRRQPVQDTTDINESFHCSRAQDTERSRDPKIPTQCLGSAIGLVDQNEISSDFLSQCDCCALTRIQFLGHRRDLFGGNVNNLNPGRRP